MSGRKQHYIPKCLLKGFEASRSGKGPQVVVLRQDRDPYVSSIDDVAAQRNFYSDLSADGTKTLDDLITDYENRLGPLLAALRDLDPGSEVDAALASEVVAHLTVRAAFARNIFSLGAQELLSAVGSAFSDHESAREILGIDAEQPNSMLVEAIDRALDPVLSHLPRQDARTLLRRMAIFWARESFSKLHGEHAGSIASLISSLSDRLPDIVRGGHTKALSTATAPDARVAALSTLRWTTYQFQQDVHLVLADCVVISRTAGSSTYVPCLLNPNDELDTVMLPLGATQLLVGTRGPASREIDAGEVNRAAAACAIDFVVSSRLNDEAQTLRRAIGTASRSTILSTVDDALATLHAPRQLQPTSTDEAATKAPDEVPPTYSYQVHFRDCADQATAERVAEVVRVIVDVMASRMPVYRIDSITFASDYEAALAELDRGFQASTPLSTTGVAYGVGVAMAPLVVRREQVKCCIVMRSWLGDSLLRPDDEAFYRTAVHTLANMIARAAFIDFVDSAFPGRLLKPHVDNWDSMLAKHIDSVASGYFASRETAEIAPDTERDYLDLLASSLSTAIQQVPAARLEYRHHGDLDAFLHVALSLIGDVLTHTATAIGHCDGLGKSVVDDDRTKALLVDCGLAGWVDVYQRDLETIYERRNQWASFRELLSITAHIERLLWHFGIYLWKTEGGGIWAEIPLHTDADALTRLGNGSERPPPNQ